MYKFWYTVEGDERVHTKWIISLFGEDAAYSKMEQWVSQFKINSWGR